MIEKLLVGGLLNFQRLFKPEPLSLSFFFFFFCFCVFPMLPEHAAKMTQGRLIQSVFKPHCSILQKQNKDSGEPILMHSGIARGTASLEGCSSFLSAGGTSSTMPVSKRRWQRRSGDFVLRRHIVAPRHSIRLNNGSLERLSRWRRVSGRSLIRHPRPCWGLCTYLQLQKKTRHFDKFYSLAPSNPAASCGEAHDVASQFESVRRFPPAFIGMRGRLPSVRS